MIEFNIDTDRRNQALQFHIMARYSCSLPKEALKEKKHT